MFVRRTRDQLWRLISRPLSELRLAVIMLDGIELHGYTCIVALGITTEGEKLALGLWEGSSENASVAAAVLADLVDRGRRRRSGLAVRDRWIEGAAESRATGVRQRRAGAAVRSAQAAKRA